MITRIKATRSVFGMLLTTIELIISLSFFFKMFDSDGVFGEIFQTFPRLSASNSIMPENYVDGRRVGGLVIVLVFMLFGYALIVIVPKEVCRREKRKQFYGDAFAD